MLQYNEITLYVSLGDFDLLKHSRHDVLVKPWANPTHWEMAVKYFKLLHARKEIVRLNIKIPRLQAWVDTEDLEIQRCATRLQSTAPLLAVEISEVHKQQQLLSSLVHVTISLLAT